MINSAIITGSAGGIGKALVSEFKKLGYFIIGIDNKESELVDVSIICDLAELVNSKEIELTLNIQLNDALQGKQLKVLINNAAVQILNDIENMELSDFKMTMDVNLIAPFLLSKLLFQKLKKSKGSIINIGSIHAKQTKPRFIAYATSKAALRGLTQAMAVDFCGHIRTNLIQPAAVSTEMLINGFDNNPGGFKKLEAYHPSGFIGAPKDIAKLAVFLSKDESRFINGSSIDIDGAIGVRLHDPD
ncbi:MAG: SDR family oxidoreductase [Gammaproteobacteria bacterium]|nr:SDR family oxidoreductase [Gammaproteobacteria bacterium]